MPVSYRKQIAGLKAENKGLKQSLRLAERSADTLSASVSNLWSILCDIRQIVEQEREVKPCAGAHWSTLIEALRGLVVDLQDKRFYQAKMEVNLRDIKLAFGSLQEKEDKLVAFVAEHTGTYRGWFRVGVSLVRRSVRRLFRAK